MAPICSVGGLAERPWGGGDLEWELGGDPVQPHPRCQPRNSSADGTGNVPRLIVERRSWGPPSPRERELVSRTDRARRCWALSCPCSGALLGWAFHLYKLGNPKRQQNSGGMVTWNGQGQPEWHQVDGSITLGCRAQH